MATKVRTISTCDRCGAREERVGDEDSVPPQHWWHVSLECRAQSVDGWANSPMTDFELCQRCGEDVKRTALTPPSEAA